MSNDNTDIKIWQISDSEWWIGAGTPQSILAAYMAETGTSHEDATGDAETWPEPLTEAQLDALMFYPTDENEQPTGNPHSFRAQLAIEIAEGGDFPRSFAMEPW